MSEQENLEIVVSETAGLAGVDETVAGKADRAFELLGRLLEKAIVPLREKLVNSAASADEVELKLDLALKAGGKWVIVSMEGAATVSLKLVWKKKP